MGDGDEIATIEALSRQFTEALKARDYAAVGGMFTNDAVICPPNSNVITGKGNVAQFWERNRRIQGLSFDSVSVKALSENALRAVGIMSLQLASPNPGPEAAGRGQQIKAKYILVWQKVDGVWKIDSGIWNKSVLLKPVASRRLRQLGREDLVRAADRVRLEAAGSGRAAVPAAQDGDPAAVPEAAVRAAPGEAARVDPRACDQHSLITTQCAMIVRRNCN